MFLLAAFAILITSVFAGIVLHSLDPDVPPVEALQGLKGLIAGALASSTALVFTLTFAARGFTLARLRLVPGRETGVDLAVAVIGVLTLGQALDSATTLAGLGTHGSMSAIRRALHGAPGPELFLAVVTIGILAGAAEELFFRGYMQSMFRERWGARRAVLVTALCFGVLHLDPVHAPLAVALGVYLGYLTERTGSALPAMACHVVNNAVYTVITALVGSYGGREVNLALGAGAAVVFVLCIVRLQTLCLTCNLGKADRDDVQPPGV
jgi:membrane protease YdiL (CAAX protease family)